MQNKYWPFHDHSINIVFHYRYVYKLNFENLSARYTKSPWFWTSFWRKPCGMRWWGCLLAKLWLYFFFIDVQVLFLHCGDHDNAFLPSPPHILRLLLLFVESKQKAACELMAASYIFRARLHRFDSYLAYTSMRVRQVRADNNHDCCIYWEGGGAVSDLRLILWFKKSYRFACDATVRRRRRGAANTRRDVSILHKLALHTLISLYVPYMYVYA